MKSVKRMGAALAIAAVIAGGVLTPQRAEAALPAPLCAKLSAAITYLQGLVAKYPNVQLFQALLADATAAYTTQCPQ